MIRQTLLAVITTAQLCQAEITVVQDYNFSDTQLSKQTKVHKGSINLQHDHLVFDGKTCLSLPSGIETKENFGFEIVASFETLKQFGFLGALSEKRSLNQTTKDDSLNQGIGIVLINGGSDKLSSSRYYLRGVLSRVGFFGTTDRAQLPTEKKISLAVVNEGRIHSLYLNGQKIAVFKQRGKSLRSAQHPIPRRSPL
jgi:hypothetical protein